MRALPSVNFAPNLNDEDRSLRAGDPVIEDPGPKRIAAGRVAPVQAPYDPPLAIYQPDALGRDRIGFTSSGYRISTITEHGLLIRRCCRTGGVRWYLEADGSSDIKSQSTRRKARGVKQQQSQEQYQCCECASYRKPDPTKCVCVFQTGSSFP